MWRTSGKQLLAGADAILIPEQNTYKAGISVPHGVTILAYCNSTSLKSHTGMGCRVPIIYYQWNFPIFVIFGNILFADNHGKE
jgi:hypothetical protein